MYVYIIKVIIPRVKTSDRGTLLLKPPQRPFVLLQKRRKLLAHLCMIRIHPRNLRGRQERTVDQFRLDRTLYKFIRSFNFETETGREREDQSRGGVTK